MRIIFLLIFFILFYSCGVVDSGPTKNFSIQTNDDKYAISNKLTAKVKFTNNLGKEVTIYNSGCGFPSFILEKLENNKWLEAGGPVCVALAVAPEKLENNGTFNSLVGMYVDDEIKSGTYRMKFSITLSESSEILEPQYLLSNTFQIIR